MEYKYKVGDKVRVMLFDQAITIKHNYSDPNDMTVMGETQHDWDKDITDCPLFVVVDHEGDWTEPRYTIKCEEKHLYWSVPEVYLMPADGYSMPILF